MQHIMIDIETLGTSPRAPIISIGAAATTGETFYVVLKPSLSPPFEPSFDTVAWWMQQPEEARAVFHDGNAAKSAVACMQLTEWVRTVTDGAFKVWANPPRFDIAIIEHLFSHYGYAPPWQHWNVLDLRTLAHLVDPDRVIRTAQPVNPGAHNALDDACYQLVYLKSLLRAQKGGPS